MTTLMTYTRQEQRHAEERAFAKPAHLRLARALQRAAFASDSSRAERYAGDDFYPAPVYLSQAVAMAADKDVFLEVLDALVEVARNG